MKNYCIDCKCDLINQLDVRIYYSCMLYLKMKLTKCNIAITDSGKQLLLLIRLHGLPKLSLNFCSTVFQSLTTTGMCDTFSLDWISCSHLKLYWPFLLLSINSLRFRDAIWWHRSGSTLAQWLVAWEHEAITWTTADLSSKVFFGIFPRTISQEVFINAVCNMCFEITLIKYTTSLWAQFVNY